MLNVTPSQIIAYLYCPRFIFFEQVLQIPQQEEKYYKVIRGREVHLRKARENVEYLRKRIGVKDKRLNQYLSSDFLRGEVDEILWLNDGTMAPLDYKFAKYEGKIYETYKIQLYCYAWLIQQNFGLPVKNGYLVYTRSQNKLIKVPVIEENTKQIKQAAEAITRIVEKNYHPKSTKYKKRCVNCTYRNICTQ